MRHAMASPPKGLPAGLPLGYWIWTVTASDHDMPPDTGSKHACCRCNRRPAVLAGNTNENVSAAGALAADRPSSVASMLV